MQLMARISSGATDSFVRALPLLVEYRKAGTRSNALAVPRERDKKRALSIPTNFSARTSNPSFHESGDRSRNVSTIYAATSGVYRFLSTLPFFPRRVNSGGHFFRKKFHSVRLATIFPRIFARYRVRLISKDRTTVSKLRRQLRARRRPSSGMAISFIRNAPYCRTENREEAKRSRRKLRGKRRREKS